MISPDEYNTYHLMVKLLNLKDQNLPPFKEARTNRINSTKKIINLVNNCFRTMPVVPHVIFTLNEYDAEWDDDMVYPKINHFEFFLRGASHIGALVFFAYNYPALTYGLRYRGVRYLFPFAFGYGLTLLWRDYNYQYEKTRLFDEFCNIRAQELIHQNSYMLEHEDVKKFVWWSEDLKETLARVHRQANNHDSSDFKDSELLLQDFLRRYTDPESEHPLRIEGRKVLLN